MEFNTLMTAAGGSVWCGAVNYNFVAFSVKSGATCDMQVKKAHKGIKDVCHGGRC